MPLRDSASRRDCLAASLLTAAALGLAFWLALIKWRSLPCLGGGCDTVIQSRYGSVLGVPVGAFGAALWIALALPLARRWRIALHATLALGALGFMVVQFGVLRAFCPYCTAHAVAALAAWRWRQVRPAAWSVAFGLLAAGAGFVVADQAATARAAAVGRPALLTLGPDALLPFDDGPGAAAVSQRPILVLSLTCPACLDLLRELTEAPWPQQRPGAALYLKSDSRDRALAATWLAACRETAGSAPRDRWLAVTAMLVAQRDLATGDPAAAAAWLQNVFQPLDAARREAARLLERHAALLEQAGIVPTPWFLPINGPARTRMQPADLWP